MKNKNLIKFVESFIFLPVLTMSSAPVGSTMGTISQAVVSIVGTPSISVEKQNSTELVARNDAVAQDLQAKQIKADAIDAHFRKYDMPLAGVGMTMVLEAEKNDLDWRLLPAIAVRESTGGKFACKTVGYNSFGWASCKIGFKSNEEAIATVALNLGGNHPKTAYHYEDKNTLQILNAYNPPSIMPRYAEQVINIMNDIGVDEGLMTNTLAIAKK